MDPRLHAVPKIKSEFNRAYVIPIRKSKEGKYEALIGQKKVICYPAQEDLENISIKIQKGDMKGAAKWSLLRNNILSQNWKACFYSTDTTPKDKKIPRFNYLFFPAGGKPACLGGGIKPGEDAKVAAARELLEESGVLRKLNKHETDIILNEIVNNLVELHEASKFKGIYFTLDIDKCDLFNAYLSDQNIEEENKRILAEEEMIKLPLEKRQSIKLSKRISEMHQLKWVPVDTLKNELDKSMVANEYQKYNNDEVLRGVDLIFKELNLFNENYKTLSPSQQRKFKGEHAPYKSCRNRAMEFMSKEPVEGNVEAADKLKTSLMAKKEDDKAEVKTVEEEKTESKIQADIESSKKSL